MKPTWTNWQTRQMYERVAVLLEKSGAAGPWSADVLRSLVVLPLEGADWNEIAEAVNEAG